MAKTSRTPWYKWPLTGVVALEALYAVMVVYATGQTLLAATLLGIAAFALWTYTSRRAHASRYLLPGIAAAVVFVIFPMLYTFGMAFTNQSSRNLLDPDQAKAYLLAEAVEVPDSQRAYTLHAQDGKFVVRLAGANGEEQFDTDPVTLDPDKPVERTVDLHAARGRTVPEKVAMPQVVRLLPALRAIHLRQPDGRVLSLASLRSFAQLQSLYVARADGALVDNVTQTVYHPDPAEGFYTSAQGDRLQPGYRVNVGLRHFSRIFSDGKFQEPFLGVFLWTVTFSALSVFLAAGLGLLLAVLLKWDSLEFKGAYRLVLFLPYAVPGFISILVFKGLFNQNLGEINLILHGLFGVKPAWFSDPLLAKTMLLIVNVWLGFPYMMVLCSGLVSSIPEDIYEAAAVAGAGPLTTFTRLTLPLILKPLTPLLISAFAFNFNNFVLVSLLTGGRPDYTDATMPAGTTDILVSYTWRIAFQDSGQEFGLAAAISTVIFLIIAGITLVQMRFTRIDAPQAKG